MPLFTNYMVEYGKNRIVRRTVAVVHAVATVLFCVVRYIIAHLFRFVNPFALFLFGIDTCAAVCYNNVKSKQGDAYEAQQVDRTEYFAS